MFEASSTLLAHLQEAAHMGETNAAAAAFLSRTREKYPNGELPMDLAEFYESLDQTYVWLRYQIDADIRQNISARSKHLSYVLPLLPRIDYNTYLAGKKLNIRELSEIHEIDNILLRLEQPSSAAVELHLEIFRTRLIELSQRAAATQSEEDISALIERMVAEGDAARGRESKPKK